MTAGAVRLDIAVIGAGAVGLATALRLQRDGHRVAIFDHIGPGEGASFGNSGIVAECEVIPLNRPETLMALPRLLADRNGPLTLRWSRLSGVFPWLCRFAWASRPTSADRSARILSGMLPGAGRAWRELASSSGAESLLEERGWLKISTSSVGVEALKRHAVTQARFGVSSTVLTGNEVRELEPGLSRQVAGGVFYPGLVSMRSPVAVMQALASRFNADGGRIHKSFVCELGIGDDRVWINDGVRRKFDRIIVAAGIGSRWLVRQLGEAIPLEAERGYHLMLHHPPVPLTRPVSVANPGYTLAPMLDGLRLASGSEFAGVDAPPDVRRIERMARGAGAVVSGLNTAPLSQWLGCRPSVPDAIPIVRPSRRDQRVIFAFGHGHLGLTLAPWTADVVSSRV